MLSFSDTKILLLNVYLPVDSKKVNEVSNETIETISDINQIIESNPANEISMQTLKEQVNT